jgi:hypothetical protein
MTLADSTVSAGMYYSTFLVRALTATPGVSYFSFPDSGYSLDNFSPGPPQNLVVAYNTGGGNTLTWDPVEETDVLCYRVYRGMSPGFTPAPENLEHTTTGTEWIDPVSDGWMYYYRITAVDRSGNESDAITTGTATATGDGAVPQALALYPNVPNPFNPSTQIRYDVPEGGARVTLRVFDVHGRLVRTLEDAAKPAGVYTVPWDGRDSRGARLASGVYFIRIESGSVTFTHKTTLLK